MDKLYYSSKAQALLQDSNTYQVLPKDPTPQLKNKLITLLKNIHQTGGLNTKNTNSYTQQVPFHPNFMASLKSIKQVLHSGPLYPAGAPSPMG